MRSSASPQTQNRVVNVRCDVVQLKLTLAPKHLKWSFHAAVISPFLVEYAKRVRTEHMAATKDAAICWIAGVQVEASLRAFECLTARFTWVDIVLQHPLMPSITSSHAQKSSTQSFPSCLPWSTPPHPETCFGLAAVTHVRPRERSNRLERQRMTGDRTFMPLVPAYCKGN